MGLSLSILFLSASILSFEIIVIRVLAISHWQPFVSLAISTALLGFGLSGTILMKIRDQVFPRIRMVYPLLTLAAALAFRPAIFLSERLHLDPSLIIRDPAQWLKVAYLIAVLTFPFTLASGALALPLHEQKAVGRYYGWNLMGAALGVTATAAAMAVLDPVDMTGIASILALLAFTSSLFYFYRRRTFINLILTAMVVPLLLIPQTSILYGPYKDISYALRLPMAEVSAEATGITGKFQVVKAPALRSAAGLSTSYTSGLPRQAVIYRSGDRLGTLIVADSPDEKGIDYLKWQTAAAPYILLEQGFSPAIVGFDAGEESARALVHGSSPPLILEPDRALSRMVSGHPELFHFWIFGKGKTIILNDNARSHLNRREARYDLIVYTAKVNLAAAAAGLTDTAENYDITVQGIRSALTNLKEGGVLALTGWNHHPPTGRWKLLGLLKRLDSLYKEGEFGGRVQLVSGWSTYTILAAAEPFDTAELAKLSAFCKERGFAMLDGDQFPGPYEAMGDGDRRLAGDLDLRPPTDSRPYPWHSIKFSYLKHLAGKTRESVFPRVEWGFFFLLMVLVLTSIFALFALMLSRPGAQSSPGLSFSIYFACLGAGYMTFEILLIKRSIMVTGPPAFTAAIILVSFLLSSGLGSHFSGRIANRVYLPLWIFAGIILFSGAAYFIIPYLLPFSVPARVLVLFLITAPGAFLMGLPFPSALMLYDRKREVIVPWAWSLNGYTSVIGSSLAGVLAVVMGFESLLLLGAGCYVAAGWLYGMQMKKVQSL